MNENKVESYFNGSFWHLIGLCIGGFIVCLITLGIAFPWVCCWFIRWQTNYTVIQGKRLQFNGTGLSLFGHFILRGWLLGIILTPLTLGLYPIYYYCVLLKKWITKNTTFEGESIQNTIIENSSQINLNQNSSNVNYIFVSGIISSLLIIGSIIYLLIFFLKYIGLNVSEIIPIILKNIPLMVGLIATIINFVYLVKNKIMFLLMAGIGYCISVLFTIYYIFRSVFSVHFSFNFSFIFWNLTFFLIIPATICILEIIKNKRKNI
jgi:hypothetical protein